MSLTRLVVHESVGKAMPVGSLVEALADLPVPVETAAGDPDLGAGDAVATFGPHPGFRDAD